MKTCYLILTLGIFCSIQSHAQEIITPQKDTEVITSELNLTKDIVDKLIENLEKRSAQIEFQHEDYKNKFKKFSKRVSVALVEVEKEIQEKILLQLSPLVSRYNSIHQSTAYTDSQKNIFLKNTLDILTSQAKNFENTYWSILWKLYEAIGPFPYHIGLKDEVGRVHYGKTIEFQLGPNNDLGPGYATCFNPITNAGKWFDDDLYEGSVLFSYFNKNHVKTISKLKLKTSLEEDDLNKTQFIDNTREENDVIIQRSSKRVHTKTDLHNLFKNLIWSDGQPNYYGDYYMEEYSFKYTPMGGIRLTDTTPQIKLVTNNAYTGAYFTALIFNPQLQNLFLDETLKALALECQTKACVYLTLADLKDYLMHIRTQLNRDLKIKLADRKELTVLGIDKNLYHEFDFAVLIRNLKEVESRIESLNLPFDLSQK